MSNTRKNKVRRVMEPIESNSKKIKLSDECDSNTEDITSVQIDLAPANISDKLLLVEQNLAIELGKIKFRKPIEYVYSPLEYAFNIHTMYIEKYCNTKKKIIFLGMNPGPWGMSQTGVPFGEIAMVRDWLKICGPVGKPIKEQPSRKVEGFQCKRSEISGKRLWGLFQELCGTPEQFFKHACIHNYCPIALMDSSGRNITPAEIKGVEQQTLHDICDKALVEAIRTLNAEIVIGIGGYAEKRAQLVTQSFKLPVKVLCLPHPSPRAVNNKNWDQKAINKLKEFDLIEILTK